MKYLCDQSNFHLMKSIDENIVDYKSTFQSVAAYSNIS